MKRFAALLALLMAMLCTVPALALGAPRYTGEEIRANPEQLAAKYGGYVTDAVKAMCKFAVDDLSGAQAKKYMLKDGMAAKAVDLFESGWYPKHSKIAFKNVRTENFDGDGRTGFSCDVYMDFAVKFDAETYNIYDVAYHTEWVCPDPKVKGDYVWKMRSFRNIEKDPDTVDLNILNGKDNGIRVEAVTGRTFKGYMLIVDDPSRVYTGTCALPFNLDQYGWQLDRFSQKYKATAVINGGGFADPNAMGKGGQANGIVVSRGKWIQNHLETGPFSTVIGFDENDRLVVRSDVSRSGAKELHLRDAVAFSPALIVNGKPINNASVRVGLSARTAIGQKEDGTVLMLVIDGRQPDSFGAQMNDLTAIMTEYGAVNAANLDGGTSTALILYGDKINDGNSPYVVSRYMPTAFIVQ